MDLLGGVQPSLCQDNTTDAISHPEINLEFMGKAEFCHEQFLLGFPTGSSKGFGCRQPSVISGPGMSHS